LSANFGSDQAPLPTPPNERRVAEGYSVDRREQVTEALRAHLRDQNQGSQGGRRRNSHITGLFLPIVDLYDRHIMGKIVLPFALLLMAYV
jgi:hypothetical protein